MEYKEKLVDDVKKLRVKVGILKAMGYKGRVKCELERLIEIRLEILERLEEET